MQRIGFLIFFYDYNENNCSVKISSELMNFVIPLFQSIFNDFFEK